MTSISPPTQGVGYLESLGVKSEILQCLGHNTIELTLKDTCNGARKTDTPRI